MEEFTIACGTQKKKPTFMNANPQIITPYWFFPLSEIDTNDLLALKHNEVQIPPLVGGKRSEGISAL